MFAALAVSRFVEDATGWSIRKFVRTARRYRTVKIRLGQHQLTAEDPLPAHLREALTQINRTAPHQFGPSRVDVARALSERLHHEGEQD